MPGADVGIDRGIRYSSSLRRCHKYSRFSPVVRIRRCIGSRYLRCRGKNKVLEGLNAKPYKSLYHPQVEPSRQHAK